MEQNDSNIDLFNSLKAEIVATEKIDENEENKEEKTLEKNHTYIFMTILFSCSRFTSP